MIVINEAFPTFTKIFGVNIYYYGLITALAVAVLYIFARVKLEKQGKSEKLLDILLVISVISGLLFGRVVYFLLNWEDFVGKSLSLVDFVDLTTGGIHLFGVIFGILIGVGVVSAIFKEKVLDITDSIALFAPIAQAIGRFGNLVNLELFGKPAKLPWAFALPVEKRPHGYEKFESFHPIFAYEAILNLISFAVIYFSFGKKSKPGQITLYYLLNYSVIRFFLEFLRVDTGEVWIGLKATQIIALAVAIICVLILFIQNFTKKQGLYDNFLKN